MVDIRDALGQGRAALGTAPAQRCLAHKKRNVLAKVPEADQASVCAFLSTIYHAPNPEIARTLADQFVEKYQHPLPTAVKTFLDDLEACLAQLRCPEVHRKAIRTTNVIERAFEELRRRTKVIPRFSMRRAASSWPTRSSFGPAGARGGYV